MARLIDFFAPIIDLIRRKQVTILVLLIAATAAVVNSLYPNTPLAAPFVDLLTKLAALFAVGS